jgi:hypothetical protein
MEMTERFRIPRRFAAIVVALLIGAATFALAASNTVPTSRAGDGNGAITGYTVTNVSYSLLASDPSLIDLWTFDLNAAASVVKSKVVASSTTYVNCTNTSGTTWQCDPATNPTVLSANQLDVIAHQ